MSSTSSPHTTWWAFGPLKDLSFVLLTPLVIWLAFELAGRGGWMDALVAFALASAMGHYLPGILRAYGDRALFKRFRTRLIIAPVFLITLTTALAYLNYSFVFLLVGVWGAWHWTMQVYGFARIYDAKAGPARTPPLLDKVLCILWFGTCVFVLNDVLQIYVARFYESGGVLLSRSSVLWFTRSWYAVTLAVTLGYILLALSSYRSGLRPNPIKFVFIAATFLYLGHTASKIDTPVVGYAMFEMWHDVQYLAIVWLFNLSRARKNPEAGRFIRFLFRPKAILAMGYVGLCLVFGMLTHAWRLFEDATIIRLAASVVPATAMIHYYLDGFIWRIREPETRAALGVVSSGSESVRSAHSRTLFAFSSPVRHALLWLLFIVPASVLFVIESRGNVSRPRLMVYEDLVETFPDSPHVRYELGRQLQELGRLREGKVHLERALALMPDSYPVLVRLGVLLADQQDLAGAKPYLQRALEIQPNDAEVRNNLAIVLDELGEHEQAKAELEIALKLEPDYALAHSNMGIVLDKLGEPEGAVRHFQQALRIAPDHAPTHNSLGEVFLKLGRQEDAKTSFQQALQWEPAYSRARNNLAAMEISTDPRQK